VMIAEKAADLIQSRTPSLAQAEAT
jgi:hypothetical protein